MNDFNAISKWYAMKNRQYLKNYKSFELWKDPIDTLGFTVYYVIPSVNPFAPSLDISSLRTLPTHFLKINENVFFWREDDYELPAKEVINQLSAVGLFDSTYIKVALGIINIEDAIPPDIVTDETIKAAKYVVCNNNGRIRYTLYSSYASSTEIPKSIRCN